MATYPLPFTDQQIADQLTRNGVHWNAGTITLSFNDVSTLGNALDAVQMDWIGRAVALVEEIIGLDFQWVAAGGNITFNGSSGNGTYASYGYNSQKVVTSAKMYFDQTWTSNQAGDFSYGSYGLMTILHEFMHTLGLSHPGAYNGSGSYSTDAEFLQDTHRYSVMSYFGAPSDGSGTSHWYHDGTAWQRQYPQTPMVYDILALTGGAFGGYFAGYSFNTATRDGATTYGYNATAGINEVFDFAVNAGPVLTIYDAGGVDTLDLSGDVATRARTIVYNVDGTSSTSSGTRTASVIDLRDGQYSSTHGMTNNIAIAFGTVIENAAGTQFDDTMHGNAAANRIFGNGGVDTINGYEGSDVLNGGAGDDTLDGGEANDLLSGGAGADVLRGGTGLDRVQYADAAAALTASLSDPSLNTGDAAGDTYESVEGIDGSLFGDVLTGNGEANWIYGNDGADTLDGLEGDDLLAGQNGNDTLRGGAGLDTLSGGFGNDAIYGDAGSDRMTGDIGFDTLFGGATNDVLRGGANADNLYGGDDTDFLYGDDGNDRLLGENGNDRLYGGLNDDVLWAGAGNDLICGEQGNDVLYGNFNWDVFVFAGTFGNDRIVDFEARNDLEKIDIAAVSSIVDFADLVAAHMRQSGADVVIDDLAGNTITLVNVVLADLDALNFRF